MDQNFSIDCVIPQPTPEVTAALEDADIVLAVDERQQREFTLFGLPPLESTASFKRPSAMRVVRVAFDYDKASLDALLKLVRRVKGGDA